MKETFYKKVGRKYVPVREYDSELMSAFPKGAHIVICYPGGKSTRYNIDPNYAAMIAAGYVAEEAICDKILEASRLRLPSSSQQRELTPEEKEAWDNLIRVFGDQTRQLEWPSIREFVAAGVKAMQEEANALMQNESVRKAYDHFVLLCKLSKNKENDN